MKQILPGPAHERMKPAGQYGPLLCLALSSKVLVETAAGLLLLAGCATRSPCLRIQDSRHLPPASLRLGQVALLASQQAIDDAKDLHDFLIASGLRQEEIKNGRVAMTRIYCCGGLMEKIAFIDVYVPDGITVELGDIVEVRVADPLKKGSLRQLNTVTQIRQKAGDKSRTCRWDPPDERLWTRILYADWMPAEGWKFKGGLDKAWYKPPP